MGGGTSCSNGSDDDDKEETSVRLKGNFFISDDANAEWVYCEDKLAEKENGIWEGEITAVKGYDNFGVEVNGTWYGAKEGLEGSVTDAELIKDSQKNFWLATGKDGKSKVTVNLNEMTITVEAVNNSTGGNTGNDDNTSGGNNDNDETGTTTGNESKEIAFKGDEEIPALAENKVSESTKSITITVTDVTDTTTDESWWFWAKTDGDKGDSIAWKEKVDEKDVYQLTIDDSTKIEYIKKNGLCIKGSSGLSAKVTVTWE